MIFRECTFFIHPVFRTVLTACLEKGSAKALLLWLSVPLDIVKIGAFFVSTSAIIPFWNWPACSCCSSSLSGDRWCLNTSTREYHQGKRRGHQMSLWVHLFPNDFSRISFYGTSRNSLHRTRLAGTSHLVERCSGGQRTKKGTCTKSLFETDQGLQAAKQSKTTTAQEGRRPKKHPFQGQRTGSENFRMSIRSPSGHWESATRNHLTMGIQHTQNILTKSNQTDGFVHLTTICTRVTTSTDHCNPPTKQWEIHWRAQSKAPTGNHQ